MIDLKTIQKDVSDWGLRNFGEKHGGHRALLGCIEELGELAHAHLKADQGIRGSENHAEKKVDAVGDLLIYLMDYCQSQQIDLEAAIINTWVEVEKRDWKSNSEDGACTPTTKRSD